MERRRDPRPWGLILLLTLAAFAYVATIPLQVATYRNTQQALVAGVDQNKTLVQQVKVLEEVGNRDVANHRIANQTDHNCIVSLALVLADPVRDRAVPPELPAECKGSPALHNAEPPR